jgi:hypothetical protein
VSTIVLACRGCCCGTTKHPDVDHDAQLDALRDAVGDRLEVTPCLGPCRWSNVVAAIDTDTRSQTWFGKVLSDADTTAVVAWLADPHAEPCPGHLVRTPPAPDRLRADRLAHHRDRIRRRRAAGSRTR